MANKKCWMRMLVIAVVFGLFLTGCGSITPIETEEDEEKEDDGKDSKNAIELTANAWSDGAITEGAEQWFKFTATAGTQYIHVSFGTMNSISVQLYTNTGNAPLGNATELRDDTRYTSWTVTSGQTYYVKVTSGTGYYYSKTGTYRIASNIVPFPPGTFDRAATLTANAWSDGNILEGEEQWFKFTATAGTHYLHVSFGTMNNMDVRLYTDIGNALGNATGLRGDTKYTSWTVTSGQVYYVRVMSGTGYSSGSSRTGTYRIAFNTVPFPPGTFDQAAALAAGVWANGNILEGEEQWFKFTATAGTHYLHVSFGTMNNIDVRLYTNTGNALGNATGLYGNTKHTSLMVTSGQVYYVRVMSGTGYSSGSSRTGTYRIACNTSETAPQ